VRLLTSGAVARRGLVFTAGHDQYFWVSSDFKWKRTVTGAFSVSEVGAEHIDAVAPAPVIGLHPGSFFMGDTLPRFSVRGILWLTLHAPGSGTFCTYGVKGVHFSGLFPPLVFVWSQEPSALVKTACNTSCFHPFKKSPWKPYPVESPHANTKRWVPSPLGAAP